MTEYLNARILVVDDMADNLVLISLALQDLGYRVLTASDGEEAVRAAGLARPDLILMDIAMPHLDGLGAARRIRALEGFGDTPIVAITAFDTSGFQRAAFDAGFDGYLTKPLDFARLDGLIRMYLDKEHTTGGLDRGETTELSPEITTELARKP